MMLNYDIKYWITGVGVILMYWFYCYKYWALRNVSVLSLYRFLPMIVPSVYAGRFYLPSRLDMMKCYEDMKRQGLRFAGIVTSTAPVLIIADLDDISDIFKDVEHFEDRGFFWSDRYFPLEESRCTSLDGRNWKEMSDKLIPCSSSERLGLFFQTIVEKREFLADIFEKCALEKKDIDVREVLSCFTANIIMLHTFGISCDNVISSAFPNSLTWLSKPGFNATMEKVSLYLYHGLRNAMRCREVNALGKVNFFEMHTFMETWLKNHPNVMRASPYVYQMVNNYALFFQESFDASCTTTNFAIYELCRNTDIQEKAREEINAVLKKCNGEFTLNSLNEMQYLGQVIDETLRMYPPAANIVKFVYREKYRLRNADLILSENTAVVIPLFAMHRDANYIPEPEVFNPERFNKSSHNHKSPLLFMPFGEGLLDLQSIHATLLLSRISLVTILSQFKLSISPRTEQPLQVDPKTFLKTNKTLYIATELIRKNKPGVTVAL